MAGSMGRSMVWVRARVIRGVKVGVGFGFSAKVMCSFRV
jgi:hypothetical protein